MDASRKNDAPRPEDSDLTAEEAEGIREALEEIDRGEGVAAAEAFAQVREELEALALIEEQRERGRRAGSV